MSIPLTAGLPASHPLMVRAAFLMLVRKKSASLDAECVAWATAEAAALEEGIKVYARAIAGARRVQELIARWRRLKLAPRVQRERTIRVKRRLAVLKRRVEHVNALLARTANPPPQLPV